jgi:hypothetical protein
MERRTIYYAVAITAFFLVARKLYLNRKDCSRTPISPLMALAFFVILSGLNFGQESLLVYPVMAFGMLSVFADIT